MSTKPLQTFEQHAPALGEHVYIADSARVIGDVNIGEDCSIWPMAVIRGDVNSIRIGPRTSVQDNAVLHCTHKSVNNPAGHPLIIGTGVTVGHSAVLHGCTLGDNILIGIHATVLDGATVEDNVMIGAGALIAPNTVVKSGYLYLGAPAKAVRALSSDEIEYLRYSAANYVKLKNTYLSQQAPD